MKKAILLVLVLALGLASRTVAADKQDVIILSRAAKICQLVGDWDNERREPTINLTGQQYNLAKTDLGVPFSHNGRTYVVFGDAWSPPDDPIAYTEDTTPEDGISLTFLQVQSGSYKPVQIPGVSLDGFEVPMEGVSVGGRMFIYATTDHSTSVTMGRSVVAVSDDNGYNFAYLYDLSTQHFINVSIVKTDLSVWEGFPESNGVGLVMFGSGSYRQSDVRLAFQPAAQIESPTSIRYFSGLGHSGQPTWSSREEDAQALFDQPYVGELSVSYNRFIHKWIMLYNCCCERGINMRTADNAWGPWSEPQIIFHPWDDGGYCHFIHTNWDFRKCDSVHDPGRQYEWGGEYGPYQFEDLAVGGNCRTTVYFTMSTWNPYTVVLMSTTLERISEEPEVQPHGLVAHWKLDETEGTIAHGSACSHDGSLHGEPLWQPVGGRVNGAIQLDGTDDYVSTPFILDPATGAFSVFAWIKGGAPGQVILSQIGDANWLCADASAGNLMTGLEGVGRGGSILTSQTPITDGNWHRVGFVWDGTNRTLYVDDVEVATDVQGSLEGSAEGLYIGAGNALEPGSFFSGLIDDVRIYDRAITP